MGLDQAGEGVAGIVERGIEVSGWQCEVVYKEECEGEIEGIFEKAIEGIVEKAIENN